MRKQVRRGDRLHLFLSVSDEENASIGGFNEK